MKSYALIPAALLALLCTAANAMSTSPYTGQFPGSTFAPDRSSGARSPYGPDAGGTPYPNAGNVYPFGEAAAPRSRTRNRQSQGFLNADPFDPNSVVNNYDRQRYANPFPYDPYYNPFGQGGSLYAPTAPDIRMGQGIPYGR